MAATGGLTGEAGEDAAIANRRNRAKYLESIGDTEGAAEQNQLADTQEQVRAKRIQEQQGSKDVSIQTDNKGNFVRVRKSTGQVMEPGEKVGPSSPGQTPSGMTSSGAPDFGIPNPPPPPANAKALSDYYRGSAVNLGQTLKFKDDLPPGLDPTTAAIITHAPIIKKPDATTAKANEASIKGVNNADDMYKLLRGMSPDDLGTLAGNWNKYIQGNTSGAKPNLAQFAETAKILGNNHAATTGVRSAQFIEDIGKSLNSLQTNKTAIASKIYAYEKSFLDHLSNHQELKADDATKNWPTQKVVRAFHPDIYPTIKAYGNKEVGPPDMNRVTASDLVNELQGK
jgi:hypothetical protein